MGHSAQTRADAVERMRDGETLASVHHDTGIARSTLSDWAAKASIDLGCTAAKNRRAAECRWAERAADVADQAGEAAVEALDEIRTLMAEGDYLNAQRLVSVFGVTVDKAQLLSGAATGRTEHADLADRILAQAEQGAPQLRVVS